jgi:hypothetical protein
MVVGSTPRSAPDTMIAAAAIIVKHLLVRMSASNDETRGAAHDLERSLWFS